MATKIEAVTAYSPRIVLGATVQKSELTGYISDRTGLNEGDVSLMLTELRDAVIFFSRVGRGVKLEGLGTFLPSIKLNGRLKLSFRLDAAIKKALNVPGEFLGKITNRESIGLTSDELVALWNESNPEDPIP